MRFAYGLGRAHTNWQRNFSTLCAEPKSDTITDDIGGSKITSPHSSMPTSQRLKILRGLTPYEAICKAWADEPDSFKYDPIHLTSGLNT